MAWVGEEPRKLEGRSNEIEICEDVRLKIERLESERLENRQFLQAYSILCVSHKCRSPVKNEILIWNWIEFPFLKGGEGIFGMQIVN